MTGKQIHDESKKTRNNAIMSVACMLNRGRYNSKRQENYIIKKNKQWNQLLKEQCKWFDHQQAGED